MMQEKIASAEKGGSEQITTIEIAYEMCMTILKSIAVMVLVFSFLLNPIKVDGSSMRPTFYNEDRILVWSPPKKPKYGDIVVIANRKIDPIPFVKRVIGVSGDEININFKTGKVWVNGVLLLEDYVAEPTIFTGYDPQEYPLIVPENHVFLLGDNRNNSSDSREGYVGCVDERYIIGTYLFLIWIPEKHTY